MTPSLKAYLQSLQPGNRFTLDDLYKAGVKYSYPDFAPLVRQGYLVKMTHGHRGSPVIYSRTGKELV